VRGLFLLSLAFLMLNTLHIRAYSEKLYKLDNLINNGDFLIDSNNDGLGDNFSTSANFSRTITSQGQKLNSNIQQAQFMPLYYNTITIKPNHYYYFKCDYIFNFQSNLIKPYLQFFHEDAYKTFYIKDNYISNGDYTISKIIYINNITTDFIGGIGINLQTSTDIYINNYAIFNNMFLIDLTASFGAGYEPSIDDFESNYLPNLDYFNEYTTMQPDTWEALQSVDYPNILEDISTVDYSTSVIANYGDNVDISIFAYMYTEEGYLNVYQYAMLYEEAKPIMRYKGKTYTLNWVFSDYSNQVMTLQMSDAEKTILKRILFNRNIDTENEYFRFDVVGHELGDTRLWFQFTNTFNLKVNIKSVLFSRNVESANDFNMVNTMFYKFFDTKGNLLEPSIRVIIGDMFESRLIDVGSRFTDVSRFNIELDVSSPLSEFATSYVEEHYFYELGIFSDSDVYIPSFTSESELDDLFPNQVCNAFEFGCQANNTLNNIARTLYTKLNIPAILDNLTMFFDKTVLFIELMPDVASSIILSGVIAFIVIGVTYVIVDRYL